MAIDVKENGDIVVSTGAITKGGADNPQRAVPYAASAAVKDRASGGRA